MIVQELVLELFGRRWTWATPFWRKSFLQCASWRWPGAGIHGCLLFGKNNRVRAQALRTLPFATFK